MWDEVFSTRAWGRWPAEEVVRAVARLRRNGLRVLEVGSGPGAQLWYLEHEGHHAVGVDFSPVAIDQARARLAAEGFAARLALADVRALPIGAEVFDVVLDVEAFAHLHESDVSRAWQEVARVLRPGGQFLSIGFSPRTHGADLGERTGERTVSDVADGPLRGLGPISFLDDADARNLSAAAGLRPVDSQLRSRTVGPERVLVEELVFLSEKPGA